MLQFDWQRHYCGYFTSTACVTDQTSRATRAGSVRQTIVEIVIGLALKRVATCVKQYSYIYMNRQSMTRESASYDCRSIVHPRVRRCLRAVP